MNVSFAINLFYENNSIINKYSRKSTRLTEFVVDQLRKLSSYSDIANMCVISPGYISRLFPYLAVTPSHLPKVLCIDKFKGNTAHYKYKVALIDGETHETEGFNNKIKVLKRISFGVRNFTNFKARIMLLNRG